MPVPPFADRIASRLTGGAVWQWLHRHPVAGDTLLALVLLALWGAVAALMRNDPNLALAWETRSVPLTALFAVLGVVPVATRRVWPVGSTFGLAAVMVGEDAFSLPTGTVGYSIAVVAYTVAAHRSWRAVLVSYAVLAAAMATILVHNAERISAVYWLANAVVLAVCLALGRMVRERRVQATTLEERAEQLEATREVLAREAVAQERRRIAREMHDVVAHHVSVMGVLAAGARRSLRRDPDAADEALATVEETGRATLRELRRLLDVLRADTDEQVRPGDQVLGPQPGVAGLDVLVNQVTEAGVPVSFTVRGEPARLPPGVDLTVYRVVQEALTNTLKHGGQATADVDLRYEPERVTVAVTDTGQGATAAARPNGHGLVGMRERVALYGGVLRVGPRNGGGFSVYAEIPLEPSPVLH